MPLDRTNSVARAGVPRAARIAAAVATTTLSHRKSHGRQSQGVRRRLASSAA
jgi:hypothetical protein